MKVKRITAMVLAALMTSATTSVAFAVQPGEVDDDHVLNFYAGPIGDDLYRMDLSVRRPPAILLPAMTSIFH